MIKNKFRSLKDLGSFVYNRRKELGLSQHELANNSSVRQAVISEIENGETDIRFSTLVKIFAGLEADLISSERIIDEFNPTDY